MWGHLGGGAALATTAEKLAEVDEVIHALAVDGVASYSSNGKNHTLANLDQLQAYRETLARRLRAESGLTSVHLGFRRPCCPVRRRQDLLIDPDRRRGRRDPLPHTTRLK